MDDHLLLLLEGSLLAFGAEAVDARGIVADFPAASMLTGLLANALGWRREERERHARLQARLHYAARIDRAGTRITDFQTAQLGHTDRGWTTRGVPEGRAGGAATYNAPHIRRRDYDADKRVVVALRLDPAAEAPTLDELEAALDLPARPLFLGRKPCLPSGRIAAGRVVAAGLAQALAELPPGADADATLHLLLPADTPAAPGDALLPWSDQRDWLSGVHGGTRQIRVRRVEGVRR